MAGTLSPPRSHAAAVALGDGRILLIGGSNADAPSTAVDVYADGAIASLAPMNIPRSDHSAVTLQDGRILVAGGMTNGGQPTWSAEIYDPATDRWTLVADMAIARSAHSASLLPDGRVLIAGGESVAGATDTLEIYDPASNAFQRAGFLSSPRKGQAATVLDDGRVLIAGGSDGNALLASVDIFDPVSGRITAVANLSSPRARFTATTLFTGNVLIVGGTNGKNDLASAEIYDTETGTLTAVRGGLTRRWRGVFPADTTFNNVPIDALQFGFGLEIADTGSAVGQFCSVLLGVEVVGVRQRITIQGVVTGGSRSAANVATYSGTCSINMGSGTPTEGVPFTATVTTDGNDQGSVALVIGSTTLTNAVVNEGTQTVK